MLLSISRRPPGAAVATHLRRGVASVQRTTAASALRATALLLLALGAAITPPAAAAPGAPRSANLGPTHATVRTVVIDPGHGGTEDGAIGPSGLKEKELTLDVAQKLAAILNASGFDVSLTRTADDSVALTRRTEIANTRRADLFVSIHANASRFAKARGAETFFLAREATDDAARTTAALENDAAGATAAGTASDSSDVPLILWDLAQAEYLAESEKLAEAVQARLNDALKIENRGVRQAPFRVLVGAVSPAVLIELGFITNPEEEALLKDAGYRKKLAEAIAAAISQYRDKSVRGSSGASGR